MAGHVTSIIISTVIQFCMHTAYEIRIIQHHFFLDICYLKNLFLGISASIFGVAYILTSAYGALAYIIYITAPV